VSFNLLLPAAAAELSVLTSSQSSQLVKLAELQRNRLPGLEQQSRAIKEREQQVRVCFAVVICQMPSVSDACSARPAALLQTCITAKP
jgi:hypothetical protein